LNVIKSENWQSQDKTEDRIIGSGSFIGIDGLKPMDWETPRHALEKAVKNVSQNTTDADCILVTGGGMRLLDLAESLEKEIMKPVIGGDVALYWGILRRLGIKKNIRGYGKLLASLV
jgi:maleate cis-trans isomerase